MKTRKNISLLSRFFILFLAIALLAVPIFAATYPKPKNNVADEAGVLSESTIRAIQTANSALEQDSGCTIAVCTVDTTGDVDIAEYARGVFTEWKMGEGVLLLIAKNDENYYFVQSVGVENILTNEVLEEIRDSYLEDDFANGEINRGVNKCVTKLKTVLTAGLSAAAEDEKDNPASDEEKGTTVGSVIIGFFKVILYIILIAVILVVVLFVVALFNDDVAALFRKYVFRRGQPTRMPESYYDERLYGQRGGSAPRNQRRNPQQQGRLNPPPQYRSYNADGTPRRNAPSQHQSTGQGGGYNSSGAGRPQGNRQSGANRQGYGNQNSYQGNRQPNHYGDGGETRSYNIPNRNNRQY